MDNDVLSKKIFCIIGCKINESYYFLFAIKRCCVEIHARHRQRVRSLNRLEQRFIVTFLWNDLFRFFTVGNWQGYCPCFDGRTLSRKYAKCAWFVQKCKAMQSLEAKTFYSNKVVSRILSFYSKFAFCILFSFFYNICKNLLQTPFFFPAHPPYFKKETLFSLNIFPYPYFLYQLKLQNRCKHRGQDLKS